jgi:signal peptidase II
MRKWHFVIAALVLLLDRATKWLVAQRIALYDSIPVIPGFFRLTHVQNRGAAFGIFDESPSEWKVWMLIIFSVAALVVVTVLLWKNSFALTATGVALSLVLGGAAGNLWDRMLAGHVTDFLLFYVGQHVWPAFNVADSAIVCGALLLVAEILFTKSPEQKAA